jgi:hypothetical protein
VAGTFDLHALIALQSGWENMGSTQFRSAFTGIPTALVDSWYTRLKAEKVEFVAAFSPGESTFPVIVVKSSEESVVEQPLGFWGAQTTDHQQSRGTLVTEQVTISIFSSSSELTRALFVVMRGIMISSVQWLLGECEYDSVEYIGGGDIDPDQDLFPEDPIYKRMMRWSAMGFATINTVNISELVKDFVVGAFDVPVDSADNKGGVDGSSDL